MFELTSGQVSMWGTGMIALEATPGQGGSVLLQLQKNSDNSTVGLTLDQLRTLDRLRTKSVELNVFEDLCL